jgi:hypothetical protein
MIARFLIFIFWLSVALFCAGKLGMSFAQFSYDTGYKQAVVDMYRIEKRNGTGGKP